MIVAKSCAKIIEIHFVLLDVIPNLHVQSLAQRTVQQEETRVAHYLQFFEVIALIIFNYDNRLSPFESSENVPDNPRHASAGANRVRGVAFRVDVTHLVPKVKTVSLCLHPEMIV